MQRQIVDENDQLIAHKKRDEIDFARDIYRVSVLWLTNSHGDVLLAQRATKDSNAAGLWSSAVAGTLRGDESYHDNIAKETREEIGLTGVEFRLGPKLFQHESTTGRRYFCQYFFATVDMPEDQFELELEEVADVKWVSRDWLERDVREHPEQYVVTMVEAMRYVG